MAEPLRVAVIGAGSMGANHARVLAELPGAALVAVADADQARAAAAASGDAHAYTDYRELLARETLDAVSIAVPTRAHLEVALACMERGLPLLVEKPLGADLDECLRLKAAAEERRVPLMVGHVERFNPVAIEAKRRLDAGVPGRVYELWAQRIGPFFERERDVGVVHDLATHDIDLLRWLLGSEVERAYAETRSGVRTPYEDALTGLLRFENSAVGVLEVNWLSPFKLRSLRVLGERGILMLYHQPQLLHIDDGEDIEYFRPEEGQEPLRNELAAFLRVARGEEPPPVTADDAIAAMRVVEALVESARRGEAVRLAAERTAR